jgi:hypothetical protein
VPPRLPPGWSSTTLDADTPHLAASRQPADCHQPCDRAHLGFVVRGILATDNSPWLMLILINAGALVLALFFRSIRAKERAGKGPLLSTSLFRSRTSNLGMVTQTPSGSCCW